MTLVYDCWSLCSGQTSIGIRTEHKTYLPTWQGEQPIMVKSKTKREKPVETTEEFVARVNAEARKRNGLKKNLKGARR